MDYEKIFLDWKTRRTFENEMPESSADSKNDTTKCAGMSDTSERNGSKLSTLCELTIEAENLRRHFWIRSTDRSMQSVPL